MSLDRENFGLFVRGSLLYDDLVEDSDTDRTPISESGKNLAGSYVRLLDAFVYGRWDLAGHELEIRAGRQVVNWGESTFIQGGINNAINHFDVASLRVPGSELREAYLPQEILKVSFGLTDNLTAEAIGIFDWDRTEPEPVGTYFSGNDFVPRGGDQVFLGFGAFSDQGTDFTPLGGPFIENFQARAARRDDRARRLGPVRLVVALVPAAISARARNSVSTTSTITASCRSSTVSPEPRRASATRSAR